MAKTKKTTMEMPEYSGCLTELVPTLDKELQPYLVEIKTLTKALKPEYVHINAVTQGMQLMADCPTGKRVFRDRGWNLFVYARTWDEVEAIVNADLDQARKRVVKVAAAEKKDEQTRSTLNPAFLKAWTDLAAELVCPVDKHDIEDMHTDVEYEMTVLDAVLSELEEIEHPAKPKKLTRRELTLLVQDALGVMKFGWYRGDLRGNLNRRIKESSAADGMSFE